MKLIRKILRSDEKNTKKFEQLTIISENIFQNSEKISSDFFRLNFMKNFKKIGINKRAIVEILLEKN